MKPCCIHLILALNDTAEGLIVGCNQTFSLIWRKALARHRRTMHPVRRLWRAIAHRRVIPAAVTISWRVIRWPVPDNPMEFDMKTFRTLAVAADEDGGICGVERNGKVIRTFPAN